MKQLLSALLICSYLFVLTGCEDDHVEVKNQDQHKQEELSMDELASQVSALLKNDQSFAVVTELLKKKEGSIELSEILAQLEVTNKNKAVISRLEQAVADSKEKSVSGTVEIPELWLHMPEGMSAINKDELLVTYPTSDDENEGAKVKAYTLDNEIVYLDPIEEPNVPVIVVDKHGSAAFKAGIAIVNQALKEAGLQAAGKFNPEGQRILNAGIETTRLDWIYLDSDKEPWTSGGAEVYAITSGIRDYSNNPEVSVIPMYYLDHDHKNYYPNQPLLFWDDYAYQSANIHLFEKDDNHNYQELASILVGKITQLAGDLSGKPWITALGEIGVAVINAMPASTFTNDDDFVDSYYSIEKNRYYYVHRGAANNAQVVLNPYFIPAN